jgi:arylsulfatase A-like enzyme
VIGRTTDESSPAWPAPVRAKEGAPNVLYIVLDDTGFGQLGCFGSPIQTPNLDGIAANGLRYNNTHTTSSGTAGAPMAGRRAGRRTAGRVSGRY